MSGSPMQAGTGPGGATTGMILDRVWRILRGQWRLFLLLASVPAAAMMLMYAILFGALFALGVFPPHAHETFAPDRFIRVLAPAMVASWIPMAIAMAWMDAAVCHAALRANRGAQSSFREAWGVAWQRAGRYLWLTVLRWLAIAGPMIAAEGVVAGSLLLTFHGNVSEPPPAGFLVLFPVVMLGYPLLMIYLVWMALRLGLAFPASLAEDLPALASLKRSWQLTRRGFWRMFLVLLVVYAIQVGVVIALEMALFIVGGIGMFAVALIHVSLGVGIGLAIVFGVLFLCAMGLFSALGWAAFEIAFVVLYDDQRGRLELAAQALGEPA